MHGKSVRTVAEVDYLGKGKEVQIYLVIRRYNPPVERSLKIC